jgi:cytochrome d ubiquinol oxidase subunit II
MQPPDLLPLWTTILALTVFFYVALDGFDLGVGMLYNFAPDRSARDLIMNSIAPIWTAMKPGSFSVASDFSRPFRSLLRSSFRRSISRSC